MKSPIRILCVTPAFNVCGGIESYCMSYYRGMSEDIRMDFITHDCTDDFMVRQVSSRGGRVFILPPLSAVRFLESISVMKQFFAKRGFEYDIIHCNMANAAPFYFHYAKKAGIKVCILHSHQDRAADTALHAIRNIPLLAIGERMADQRLACSDQAGKFLFKDHPFTIIKNAIDPERFRFDEEKRARFRASYGIGDDILIGTIGRLTEQKNFARLIDIFNALTKRQEASYRLVIVGEGHLLEQLKSRTREYGLLDRVIFTGTLPDVSDALCGMDVFVLPSLYEGLGIVNIEAQACGLGVVVSDAIPEDADMGGDFHSIPLDASDDMWAERIALTAGCPDRAKAGSDNIAGIKERGYDIRTEAVRLEEYYMKLIN